MQVRPYRLLGQPLLAAALRVLDGAVDAWCADWGVARADVVADCARAWERGARPSTSALGWRSHGRRGEATVWLAASDDLAQPLQRALFAPDRTYAHAPAEAAPLAAAATEAALRALLDGLLAALMPGATPSSGTEAPPAEVYDYASGALSATISVGRQSCTCVLNAAALSALAEQARLRGQLPAVSAVPLKPLDYRTVLGPVPVAVPVEIGRVQLRLGSLLSLGIGDVIRLDSAADHPLRVHGPNGQPLFDAYLGLADQQVALEVVRRK